MDNSTLHEVKTDIIAKAIDEGKINELTEAGFFNNISQIERSGKIRTHDRIWIGRMLKKVFGRKAPNPDNIAIFQAPDQFKRIREWEQKKK
jgi:hypothetical protein